MGSTAVGHESAGLALLGDGRVLVAGGHALTRGRKWVLIDSAELYDPKPMLNGFVSASDIPVADGTNGVTYGVRLYETAPNAWSAVAVELAPTNQVISFAPTPISLTNIFTIGMISGSIQPPYIDNLTLDVSPVPEPSTFVLGIAGMAALGLITLRKKLSRA